MEIVVEISLCINLFLNSFILKLTERFLREKARLWFVSALFGTTISLISPLFSLPLYAKILLQIAVAFIMICISFRYSTFKKFILTFLVFILTTFIFGGGCYALQNIIGQFPIFIVVIISSIIYFACCIVLHYQHKASIIKNFTYKVILKDGQTKVEEEGFLDSGNMLYDTITKKPIILVTFEVFHKFYQDISYLSAWSKKFNESSIKNGHYIKINSVGSGTSIFVFTVDELSIGENKTFKNVMLGLSFSGFEKSFGKNILLHSELV